METVFKSENLCKKYGSFTALSDLNMEIPKGAIYGFVGKTQELLSVVYPCCDYVLEYCYAVYSFIFARKIVFAYVEHG